MANSEEAALDPAEASRVQARCGSVAAGTGNGRGLRVALVASRFNGRITTRLLDGAIGALEEAGVSRHDVTLAWVPGAFEIPLAARALLSSPNRPDAVVALGAVIRGETGHYELVAGECARGVQQVQLETGRPVVFGVLTVNTLAQALERSEPDETNKGREAAQVAIEMATLLDGPLVA